MSSDADLLELAEDPQLIVTVQFTERGKWRAFLGDKAHGYRWNEILPSFTAAVEWLRRATYDYYPESQYVRLHPVLH